MTKEELHKLVDELIDINGIPYSFFLSWKPSYNIENREHGKFDDFWDLIDTINKSDACVSGLLPINTINIFFNSCVLIIKKDKYWDCVNDMSYDSHDVFSVPYVGTDGNWIYLTGNPNT